MEDTNIVPCLQLYAETAFLANANNVKMQLVNDEFVLGSDGIKSNGYFIDTKPTLAVAYRKPFEKWLPIFIHESCHMDQWIEKHPLWMSNSINDVATFDLISLWLENKIDLNQEQRNNIIGLSRDLEADCERRTIEKILKYGIDINVETYAQKANAYIYFYNIMSEVRKWYEVGREPYNVEDVWTKMPKIISDDCSITPVEIREAFKVLFPELGA